MKNQTTPAKIEGWEYLVAGEFRHSQEQLAVHSPYDGSVVGVTSIPTDADVDEAVRRARDSFKSLASLPTYRRAELLRALAAGVEARQQEFVRLLALEVGKPVKAGAVEVQRAIFNLRYAAEEAHRPAHEFIPLDLVPAAEGRWGIVRRFPLGPVLAITPFNFPVNLVLHKLAPALAVGNSLVLKPSPRAPLCSLLLGEMAVKAGLLPGALSVLPCSLAQTERLVQDERFKMLTFTGSAAVGWKLKAMAGKKRVVLELGGNAAAIVCSDGDLDLAAARCAAGGFSYAGQNCVSVQRIFVHRPVYNVFLKKLVAQVSSLRVGDPLDDTTDVGPLITHHDVRRVEDWVSEAVRGGAKIVVGGKREGNIYYPTILVETQPEMRVNSQEIFAPLVTAEPYDTFEEALARVNHSPFGLQAGVFTRDVKAVFQAFEALEVGGVVVNDVSTFRADHMPFGGTKDSGLGREGVRYAIEEMTERRILVLNLP